MTGILGIALLLPTGIAVFRASMGTAYVSLLLLSVSLLIGPLNVLWGRPNPVSADLRRDVGIWAALWGLAHVVFGLQVHLPGRPWEYFLWPAHLGRLVPFRYDAAGASNHTGLAATLILLALLAVSNDAALRRLGTGRWKSVQRWNYVCFALVTIHGVIYQVLEQRAWTWVGVFALTLLTVVVGRVAAWRHLRSRQRH